MNESQSSFRVSEFSDIADDHHVRHHDFALSKLGRNFQGNYQRGFQGNEGIMPRFSALDCFYIALNPQGFAILLIE